MTPVSNSNGLRVAVIGGGVIGLSTALALARSGADVSVFEAGASCGLRASSRAGGMLGLSYELDELRKSGTTTLALRAMELWPEFAASLPLSIDLRRSGVLACATTAAESLRLESLAALVRETGLPSQALSAVDIAALEPALAGPVLTAWRFPADGQVDPRSLVEALARALTAAGVRIALNAPVGRIEASPEGFRIPEAGNWDRVLIATGVGGIPEFRSSQYGRLDAGLGQAVPVKGHMLALEPGAGALAHVIRAGDVYIIPKSRWTLVGATSEPDLADEAVDPDLIDQLRTRAEALVPGLRNVGMIDAWAGVRPGSPDGAPQIGETAIPGAYAALGCYRNGILLAPAVAELAAAILLGRDGNGAHGRFNPRRFDNRAAALQSP
jgi:glycine oxidase